MLFSFYKARHPRYNTYKSFRKIGLRCKMFNHKILLENHIFCKLLKSKYLIL